MSSFNSLFRKAVFTSSLCNSRSILATIDMIILIEVNFAIGEYVSTKSIPSCWVNLLATNLVLHLSRASICFEFLSEYPLAFDCFPLTWTICELPYVVVSDWINLIINNFNLFIRIIAIYFFFEIYWIIFWIYVIYMLR
jgi:hypothetical protein